MKQLTLEQHRARIENIKSAEANNRKYLRRHRIHDYMPGHVIYNLGDYPAPFSIEPTEYDYNMLKDLAENGVELIQIHEEWNDAVRHLGADKFTSHDPKGLHHFVDLCHHFGIKIIPYISSGYFHVYDPDFREEFSPHSESYCINGMHFKYRRCSAGSAEWREYILPRTFAILDEYGFDGIYNDMGMDSWYKANGRIKKPELAEYDPETEDLLSIMYTEVKKRGGVYKLHCDRNNPAPCLDKVYDYLSIGELMGEINVGIGKTFPDYVIPCQDKVRLELTDPDRYLASVIPFMQFPMMTSRGRPLMGKRIEEDIPYYSIDVPTGNAEYLFNKRVGEYMREHPNGPYVYSLWSSIPDDPEEYPRWCKYLKLYRPMVEENSVAYIELRVCDDILSPLPDQVYASMFVNEKKYLVLSNLTDGDYYLKLREKWIDRQTNISADRFIIKPGKLLFLMK